MRIALFDLDRTITRKGTFTPFLMFVARARPWLFLKVPALLFYMLAYVMKRLTRKTLKQHMLRLFLAGMAREELGQCARGFALKLEIDGLRPETVARIRAHQAAGDRVVIATASMDFYVPAIAARLGITDVIATRGCFTAEDRLLARIKGENCYGEHKKAMVEAWLAAEGLTGAEIHFYTDHHTDAATAELAMVKVAVHPNKKLAALAGWERLDG